MGILDSTQESTDLALAVMASQPLEQEKPKSKHSAWSVVPRAVAAGAVDIGGNIMDTAGAFGQVAAASGGLTPGFDPDQQSRRAESVEASDKLKREGIDWRGEEGQAQYDFAHDLRPDPITAGTAENIVFGLTKGLTKGIGSMAALGPVGGATAFGVSEGMGASEDLARAGVDFETRTQVGAATGVLNTAMMALPVAGNTMAKTVGLAFVGGPASFIAQQQATRSILENANYSEIAQQYDPLDPVGLTIATLLPAGFGAAAMRGARSGTKGRVAETKVAESETVASETVTAAAPQEHVDAAMVHNLTAVRDARESVESSMSAIPRAERLSPSERAIETALADRLAGDYRSAVHEYNALPDAMGGKVLNVDTARELSPDYAASRETRSMLSAAVHEPASHFIKQVYAERLASMPPDSTVMFMSGGTGAGKSTSIGQVSEAAAAFNAAHLVYDTNMNGLQSALKKINQALESGGKVDIWHVQRDPVEALVNGALPRAVKQGRAVPLKAHEDTHIGSAKTIAELSEIYKDDPRVSIRVLDNTRGKGNTAQSNVEFVKGFDYNNLRERLVSALQKEYQNGRISDAIYRGTLGEIDAGRAHGTAGDRGRESPRVAGRLPERQRSGNQDADGRGSQERLPAEESGTREADSGGIGPKDPHIRSVLNRAEDLKQSNPDMPVAVREDGSYATASEELAAIRRQALEGTDTEFGAQDAPLLRVAAECLLAMGAK